MEVRRGVVALSDSLEEVMIWVRRYVVALTDQVEDVRISFQTFKVLRHSFLPCIRKLILRVNIPVYLLPISSHFSFNLLYLKDILKVYNMCMYVMSNLPRNRTVLLQIIFIMISNFRYSENAQRYQKIICDCAMSLNDD